MTSCVARKFYDEKESEEIWKNIVNKKIKSLNKSLMKVIAHRHPVADKHREESERVKNLKIGDDSIPLYSKQMWDSQTASWVPFSFWGAHFIVNDRKEHVAVRIYAPCDFQPEFGPTVKGWRSLDTSYLNERLKENTCSDEDCPPPSPFNSFAGYKDFKEIIRQDRNEYSNPF